MVLLIFRDVEQLNSKIKSLEKILKVLAPQLDLSSLPRTADQARTMANSNRINEPETNAHTLLKERMIKPDVGDPCYLHEVLTSMAQLHLSSLDYLDNEDSLKANSATFPTRWERSDQSGEPDLAYLMTNDHRSIVERSMERQHFRHALGSHCYPPPDLAESLLHLYFQKVHPYEYILHQGEFMQDYKRGLAEHDASFRSLCYAIFAAASRFSTDLRVMPAMDGPQVNRQAAGALYVVAAGTLLTPMSLPCTLFDLQAMAVLSYVLISTSSPTTAWFMVGMSLRRGEFETVLSYLDSPKVFRHGLAGFCSTRRGCSSHWNPEMGNVNHERSTSQTSVLVPTYSRDSIVRVIGKGFLHEANFSHCWLVIIPKLKHFLQFPKVAKMSL